MAESKSTPLDRERYINLETFRKDGVGVKTPVWVAPLDGRLVILTDGTSYKVKRLRRNSKCRAAACTVRGTVTGPWLDGQCRILDDPADKARAHAALRQKYGWILRMTDLFAGLARRIERRAYLEVTLEA
jgi:PPOX class probable F420-dependent enzyme